MYLNENLKLNFFFHYYNYYSILTFTIMGLSGAVVSTSNYESAGLSSIPGEGSQRTVHPTVHSPKWFGW